MRPPDPRPDRRGPGLSRRSMVRAAGHAAWVAPLVSVASAAPALAASQDQALVVTVATYYLSGRGPWSFYPYVEVRNQGSVLASQLTLNLAFPKSVVGTGAVGWTGSPGPAWSSAPQLSRDGSQTLLALFTSASGLRSGQVLAFGAPPGVGTPSFALVLQQLSGANDAVTVVVGAAGFTSGSALLDAS